MAWICYTDEDGARVEDDETGDYLIAIASERVAALPSTALADALRVLLPADDLASGAFVDDDRGVSATGIDAFEALLIDPNTPPSRHAGKFPHLGDA